MHYFSEMTLSNNFHLLAGMEGEEMIFAHFFKDKRDKEELIQLEKMYFPRMSKDDEPLMPIFEDLQNYSSGKNIDPVKVKVKFSRGTEFEKRVWKTLRRTRKGNGITYKQLAEKSGFPRAQRAVGQAVSKNYLVLFVPCHRVIASGNKLGGFSSGIDLKKYLLDIENVNM